MNGCIGKENDINISIKPAPQKPVASSVGKLCEGDSIKLNAAGSSDLIYKWSGPNYFVSNLQNPVIANAKINNNGVYKVFAVKDGCAGLPDSLSIAVNPIPGAPAAKSNAPLCDGTTLNFSVEQIQNTSYSWTGPNGFSSSLPNPVISTVNINSSGSYKVVALRNGCTSPETLLNVQVKELPLIAGLSNNGPLCNGNDLVLSTTDIPGTQYKWTGPAGFSADIASPHLSAAGANNKGNYTLSITRNGCSSKPATTLVDIRDRIKVSAGADQTFCNNVGIINTNASEVGQSGILWTTSGTGTFSPNNHTLNALYLLSSSDRQQNAIKLSINVPTLLPVLQCHHL